MHIRIADFVFHGGDLPSLAGFTVSSLTGWTGGPGVKRDSAPRRGAAGSFNIPGYSTDRVVTFRGLYHGTSLAEVQHVADALSGLESRQVRATVAWPDTRWVDAHVDRVRFVPAGWKAEADYQVELWMPDPFKYGETRESGSAGANVSAFHRGNTAAVPRFRVAGLWSGGYRIRGPQGQSFSVVGTLNSNVVDEVDFRTGMVRRNGVPLTRAVLSPEMWSVPGGAAVQWRVEGIDGGSGSAVMYLTDTFV